MTAIDRVKKAQRAFGLAEEAIDGDPGPQTEGAWTLLKEQAHAEWAALRRESPRKAKASSFADPADIAAFKRCKATGKTDKQCFAVGDNGIGQFGADTAQDHTPMCALHADEMTARWSSVSNAAHKKVKVTAEGRSVVCAVEDRMSARGRIDLNPAAAKKLGLRPPFLIACEWEWV